MSEQTLKAVHEAIAAHIKDRQDDEDVVLGDWFICYSGMVSSDESPDGILHVTGYATSEDSTPHASMGLVTISLKELEENILHGICTCPPPE